MALIRIGFFSQALGMCTSCDVILPQQPDADAPVRVFPTVYLLHGLTKGRSSWQRMTSIERYAVEHGVAVVMPEAHLSAYSDMEHGGKFFTYIADELPEIMRGFFPLSDAREDTFICGCSMGGYGAVRIGLNRPEQYGAIGCLSSGFSACKGCLSRKSGEEMALESLIFGEGGIEADTEAVIERAKEIVESGEEPPRIFITCGSEDDHLLDYAREACDFFASFEGNPFDLEYSEHPGGHNWAFWDQHISDFFRFAGLEGGQKLL